MPTAKVWLTIPGVVVHPLSVEDVVHGDNVVALAHRSTPDTPELLHVASDAEQQAEVDAEGTDVGSGLARDPEDGEVAVVVELDELALVDGAHAELALDGRDERRALEERSGERLEATGEGLLRGEGGVEANDADVLLSCGLRKRARVSSRFRASHAR